MKYNSCNKYCLEIINNTEITRLIHQRVQRS